jgi:TRAP-type C4-dicarboxylate transport system permease small subunit
LKIFFCYLRKFLEKVELWAGLGSTWLVVFIMLLVTCDVTYRAVAGKAILGAYNLTEIIMVAVCFFALAYTQNKRGHVRMEIVVNKMKGRARLFIEIVSLFICLLISALMFYRSIVEVRVAIGIHLFTPGVIKWPAWPLKIVVVFGVFLLCLRIAIQLGQQVRHLIYGGEPS